MFFFFFLSCSPDFPAMILGDFSNPIGQVIYLLLLAGMAQSVSSVLIVERRSITILHTSYMMMMMMMMLLLSLLDSAPRSTVWDGASTSRTARLHSATCMMPLDELQSRIYCHRTLISPRLPLTLKLICPESWHCWT